VFSTPSALLTYCSGSPNAEASYAPQGQSPAQTLSCAEWPGVFQQSNIPITTSGCPSAEQLAGIVDPTDPCQVGTISPASDNTGLIIGAVVVLGIIFFMTRTP